MSTYNVRINQREFQVELQHKQGSTLTFAIEGRSYTVQLSQAFKFHDQSSDPTPLSAPTISRHTGHSSNTVVAPMPGIIVNILAKEGDVVTNGQTLLVMEAMKMENNINSTRAGKIKSIHVKKGEEVQNGAVLVSFEP